MAVDYDLWKTTPDEEYNAGDWLDGQDMVAVLGDKVAEGILRDLFFGRDPQAVIRELNEAVDREFEKAMQDTRDYDDFD